MRCISELGRSFGCDEVTRVLALSRAESMIGTIVSVGEGVPASNSWDEPLRQYPNAEAGLYVLRKVTEFVDPFNGTMPYMISLKLERIGKFDTSSDAIDLEAFEKMF